MDFRDVANLTKQMFFSSDMGQSTTAGRIKELQSKYVIFNAKKWI